MYVVFENKFCTYLVRKNRLFLQPNIHSWRLNAYQNGRRRHSRPPQYVWHVQLRQKEWTCAQSLIVSGKPCASTCITGDVNKSTGKARVPVSASPLLVSTAKPRETCEGKGFQFKRNARPPACQDATFPAEKGRKTPCPVHQRLRYKR